MRESLHSVRELGREGRDSPRAPPRAKGVGERCEYNPLVGTKGTGLMHDEGSNGDGRNRRKHCQTCRWRGCNEWRHMTERENDLLLCDGFSKTFFNPGLVSVRDLHLMPGFG